MLHTGNSGRISVRRHSEIGVCEAHRNSDNANSRMTAMRIASLKVCAWGNKPTYQGMNILLVSR